MDNLGKQLEEAGTSLAHGADKLVHKVGEEIHRKQFDVAGIQFLPIPPERAEEVLELLAVSYLPDNPIDASVRVQRSDGFDAYITRLIEKGACIMATDSDGKIVGVRLAEIIDVDDAYLKMSSSVQKALASVLSPFHSDREVIHWAIVHGLEYNLYDIAAERASKRVLTHGILCVAPCSRKRGLGTELLVRSEELAVAQGCDLTVVMGTTLYSQAIFRRRGYTALRSVNYLDLKASNGTYLIPYPGKDTSCVVFLKVLLPQQPIPGEVKVEEEYPETSLSDPGKFGTPDEPLTPKEENKSM